MAKKIVAIIKCIKVLTEKRNFECTDCDVESMQYNESKCCKSDEGVVCVCHEARVQQRVNGVLKRQIIALDAEAERAGIKRLLEKQGLSTLMTNCLCYEFVNRLLQDSCEGDIIWQFTTICLKLLLAVMEVVEEAEGLPGKHGAGKHSPNLLGVQDEATIYKLVELVTTIGIFPNFLPGVGLPMKNYPVFQSFLPKTKVQPRKMFIVTHVLVSLLKNKTLNTVIMARSCNDIIASLIQLRHLTEYYQSKKTDTVCCCVKDAQNVHKACLNCHRLCKHMINWAGQNLDLLIARTYQPVIIKELLILQRSCILSKKSKHQKNFLTIVGRKLSHCLMQTDGVRHVIEGILAGCGGADSMNQPRYKSIGKLIACVPKQVSTAEEYYKLVCPQVLAFLESPESSKSSVATQYEMVAVAAVEEMVCTHYNLTEAFLFTPLLHPLLNFFNPGGVVELSDPLILKCIKSLHVLTVFAKSPSEKMVALLLRTMHPLFYMLCLHPCSIERKTVLDIMMYLLNHMNLRDCINFLTLFIFGTIFKETSDDAPTANSNAVNSELKIPLEVENKSSSSEESRSMFTTDKVLYLQKELVTQLDKVPIEERVSCLLLLLKDKQMENARGEFFVVLLEQLSRLLKCANGGEKESNACGNSQELKEIDTKIADIQHKIQLVSIISALIDTFGDSILQNTPQTVAFIKGILDLPWTSSEGLHLDTGGFHEETIDLALMLISFLVKTDKLTTSDFTLLTTLVPSLEVAASKHSKHSSRALATDLKVYIATRGSVKPEEYKESESSKRERKKEEDPLSEEAYKSALIDLTDPLLPTRGRAVFKLSKLLRARNKFAVKDHERLLGIFETNLAHDDTYLYLAAVEGLIGLVDVHHKHILPLLCRKFAQFRIVAIGTTLSSELRVKLGEAIVKSCRLCGDILPIYSQMLLSALMTGVKDDDELVRASSLSAIGDVCKLLKFSIGSIIAEVVSCIHHVVSSDKSPEVRRAAIQVFSLMFEGVGSRIMQEIPDSVRDIYRLLKIIASRDEDSVTQLHASNALDLLDDAVKDALFPKQTLEKNIQVLS